MNFFSAGRQNCILCVPRNFMGFFYGKIKNLSSYADIVQSFFGLRQ